VFSLKNSTEEAFVVPFWVLGQTNMTGGNGSELVPLKGEKASHPQNLVSLTGSFFLKFLMKTSILGSSHPLGTFLTIKPKDTHMSSYKYN